MCTNDVDQRGNLTAVSGPLDILTYSPRRKHSLGCVVYICSGVMIPISLEQSTDDNDQLHRVLGDSSIRCAPTFNAGLVIWLVIFALFLLIFKRNHKEIKQIPSFDSHKTEKSSSSVSSVSSVSMDFTFVSGAPQAARLSDLGAPLRSTVSFAHKAQN